MAKISVLNGPNLNLLGTREPALYGRETLSDIQNSLESLAQAAGHSLTFFQSNAEHELVNAIHNDKKGQTDFILINPAAFTHTSVAIRDALLATEIPFFEIHLSNVYAREAFRKHSYFSDIAKGVISGFGGYGYELALQAAFKQLNTK